VLIHVRFWRQSGHRPDATKNLTLAVAGVPSQNSKAAGHKTDGLALSLARALSSGSSVSPAGSSPATDRGHVAKLPELLRKP
jgi:hypothetical protein